jgi:hypothetical protein
VPLTEWLNSSEFSRGVLPFLFPAKGSLIFVNIPITRVVFFVRKDFSELTESLILLFNQIII